MSATTLTPAEKRALTKRCCNLEILLMNAGMHFKLRNLLFAAESAGSIDAVYAALAMWEALGPDEHAKVQARADFNDSPQERARKMETHCIERLLQDEIERPVKRRGYLAKRWEKQVAAYRAELRHRRNPHLTLVWVNDAPPRKPTMAALLARSRNSMTDILDMLNEGCPGNDAG